MQTFRVVVTIVLLAALLLALWRRDPFPLDPVAFLGFETDISAR